MSILKSIQGTRVAKSLETWSKLDNSAKIYPMLVNKKSQNIFRLSVNLKKEVDAEVLQEALSLTIGRFPGYQVRLMKGVFWYYFDQNNSKLSVYPLDPVSIKKITDKNCNGYCFRVSYFKNQIVCDFFHAICDATGAAEFVKSLVYTYLNLLGYDVYSDQKILTVGSPVTTEELEDAFLKNYKRVPLSKLKIKELQGKKAYHINGILFDNAGNGIIHMYCDAKQLLDVCHAKGCTMTEYLGALFMLSIYESKIKDKIENANDIQLFVPINLRKIFPSKTLRNFSLFSRVGANPYEDMELDKLIEIMHTNISRDINKDRLKDKISTTVWAEKFFLVRFIPLFLKRIFFNFSNTFWGKAKKTATLSNFGVLDLPESMKEYVDSASFSITSNATTPLSLSVITCNGKACITFTRRITDTDIERLFAKRLSEEGIDLQVTSNFWEVDNAL
ncbi:MAG: hypothetical protein HFE34_02865 [Clostridia bacterium]|nr:hypothetical protein [Clostridia bacterium]